MPYAWNWFGLANVCASVLLLVLGLLFLKAKRSEFAAAFAAYCVFAAGQKFTGGIALYFATDAATRSAWLLASTLLLLASTPTLAHALTAFTWPSALRAGRARRVALYVPFALLIPVVVWQPALLALVFAGIFLTLLAVFVVPVARRASATQRGAVRTQSRYMLAYLAIALGFSAEARVLLVLNGRMPWWELSIAYMVATGILLYGILRTHLFDIDLRVKLALRHSTVAAIVVATGFVVSELAASFLSVQIGTVFGILAAGLLVLAIHPLQRLADRLADRAMPNVRDSPEYLAYRRLEVYRAAVELALRDGVVTPHERQLLDGLRRNLGIPELDAQALERDHAPLAPPLGDRVG